MAAVIKYGTNITWGASDAGSYSNGIILSASRKRTTEVAEIKDANGENHSVVFYDPKEEITAEILVNGLITVPAPGDEVSIAGVTAALVIDAEEVWSNTEAKKLRLTLKKWLA